MVLQVPASEYINDVPLIDQVVSLVVGVTENSVVYIAADVWLHYKTVLVTSIGSDGAQKSRLTIGTPFSSDCRLSSTDGDSIIVDTLSESVVILDDFTPILNGEYDKFLPEENQAVLEVKICDQLNPVLFVTTRPRLASMDSTRSMGSESYNWRLILLATFIVVLAGCISWCAFSCRRRHNNQTTTYV